MYKFADNSRICFIGDSITAVFNYEAIIANFYIENFPSAKIKIYNCAAAGGTAKSQLDFLKDDVLCHNPTHAVITLGVNDSRRWAFEKTDATERYCSLSQAYSDYRINLSNLCDELEKNGVQIILCTPPPYAEYQQTDMPAYKGGYALMLGYAFVCRQLAQERGYPLCDYHEFLTQKMLTEDIFINDHVHLTDKGHFYIAKCFLEFQGYELNEKKPLPPMFDKLIESAMVLRHIYAVEVMIIGNYGLPTDKKLEFVQKYLDEGRARNDYFVAIAKNYINNKPKMKKYEIIVEQLTNELMG